MRRIRVVAAVLVLGVLALAAYLFARAVLGTDLVRSAVEAQLAARLGQPVRIASAGASIFPRLALDLRDVSIGVPAVVQFGHARVVTGLRGLFSRTIADAEVVVSDGRIVLPAAFALVPAAAAPEARGAAPSAAFTVTSIAGISLRNVDLIAGERSLRVDLDSSVHGDRLDIRSLTARAKTTRLDASGALSSLTRFEGRLDAKTDRLDLDEMIATGAAMVPPDVKGEHPQRTAAGTPVHLTINLTAASGQFASYAFRELSTTADLVPGRILLTPLSVRAFGGRFDGRLNVATGGNVPELLLAGRVDALDVADVMKANGSPGGVTGRLRGSLRLTADGSNAQAVMRTTHGTIDAAITDGTMPRLDMVRTIVLAFGKPSGAPPAGSGSSFSRLGGMFALTGGTLTSDNVALSSRDFDMHGRTTVRLGTGEVNARADVVLSEELTAQSGTDLRRYAQQDGRVVVPATIGGTLDHPSVSLDVAAATQRAIENELKRRASSWLDGLFKKKKGGG